MKSQGLTLIELMVVVAILAIILAIAVPSYQRHVEQTRRADAQSALLDAAQRLERCFTRNNSYQGCDIPNESSEGFYSLGFEGGNPGTTTYTLVASPQGAQEGDACGDFTLDHLGNREADGGTGDRCWGR